MANLAAVAVGAAPTAPITALFGAESSAVLGPTNGAFRLSFRAFFTMASETPSRLNLACDPRNKEAPMAQKHSKYEVNIEGTIHDWDRETITVPQIRELGGLPTNVPVVEIDLKDNTEQQLAEDAVIELKPGQGFAKKVSFKRG